MRKMLVLTVFLQYMDKYARVRFHFHFLGEPGEVIPVHVHKYGDISHNCGTIGGHYDPYIEDRFADNSIL